MGNHYINVMSSLNLVLVFYFLGDAGTLITVHMGMITKSAFII